MNLNYLHPLVLYAKLQEEPEFRPTMSEVVQDLTQALDADDVSSSNL